MDIEKLKNSDVDVLATLVQIGLDNNKLMRTILDVLIDIRLDGKSNEEREKIGAELDKYLNSNMDLATDLLVIKK